MNIKVIIKYTSGTKNIFKILESDIKLIELRKKLIADKLMKEDDMFLSNNAEISLSDENDYQLKDIITHDEENENSLYIGHANGVALPDTSEVSIKWINLNEHQKNELLLLCELNKGMIISLEKGFQSSPHNLYSWNILPDVSEISDIATENTTYYYSKFSREISRETSHSGSIALDIPYINTKIEHTSSQEKVSSSSKITEYLMHQYIIPKASFYFNAKSLIANNDFIESVDQALKNGDSDKDKLCNLLHMMNEWGHYIPLHVTLGGAFYSYEETQISDYAQAEKEKQDFAIAAEIAFGGYSSGLSYEEAMSSSSSSSSSNKYKNISIVQIGGASGISKNRDSLAILLDNVTNWRIVNIEKFYPSLMLLNNHNHPYVDKNILSKCLYLFNKYYHLPVVKTIQPVIDFHKYATEIEQIIFPW